ncbi:MAG: sporulation protein YqfD [Anaeroplasma sp.]
MYKLSMKKSDFFKIHNKISTRSLSISEDEASFEVELGSLNIIKESGYEYKLEESLRTKITMFMKSYYMIIIGVAFLFSILYINSYRVNRIIFNIETPINKDIETEITSNYKRLFSYDFADIDYALLSKKLQKKYIEYPYIAVYSRNNNILVDIYKENEYPSVSSIEYGNIIAKKDAIIDSYFIYNGTSHIYKNKYVKKGDILIEALGSNGGQGLILGYTYEKIEVDVPVSQNEYIKSEESIFFYSIEIFGNSFYINKKESFNLYEEKVSTSFNLFDIFKINKIEQCEKYAIIKENSINDAINIAEEKIIDAFKENVVSDLEKIVDIYPYSSKLINDKYHCTFIVKKVESIGELNII